MSGRGCGGMRLQGLQGCKVLPCTTEVHSKQITPVLDYHIMRASLTAPPGACSTSPSSRSCSGSPPGPRTSPCQWNGTCRTCRRRLASSWCRWQWGSQKWGTMELGRWMPQLQWQYKWRSAVHWLLHTSPEAPQGDSSCCGLLGMYENSCSHWVSTEVRSCMLSPFAKHAASPRLSKVHTDVMHL